MQRPRAVAVHRFRFDGLASLEVFLEGVDQQTVCDRTVVKTELQGSVFVFGLRFRFMRGF